MAKWREGTRPFPAQSRRLTRLPSVIRHALRQMVLGTTEACRIEYPCMCVGVFAF